jgi:hypothetical protein
MGAAAADARAGDQARCGLFGRMGGGDADANDESFGVLVFGGIRLAGRFGVKKEASAPHSRLVYIHLLSLLLLVYRSYECRLTALARRVNKKSDKNARQLLRLPNAT